MSLDVWALIYHCSLVGQVYFLLKHFSVIFIDFLNEFFPLAEHIRAWIGLNTTFYVKSVFLKSKKNQTFILTGEICEFKSY